MNEHKNKGGRPRFEPTPQQRRDVELMVGYGIPEEIIALLIRPPNGKPIGERTLRRHFKAELALGGAQVKQRVGNFIVASILGLDGGIKDDRARATLAIFFAKARMGWREVERIEHAGSNGGPLVIQISPTDDNL